MKMIQLTSLSAGLLIFAASAEAQNKTCTATVVKRSAAESQTKEKTWDIIFDVAAPTCDSSRGQFDFMVEVSSKVGTQRVPKSAEFATEDGKRVAVTASFHAKPGQEFKDVSSITVTQCICAK